MTSNFSNKFNRTFRDLELAIEEVSDRNLARVLAFIVEVLGTSPDGDLAEFFSDASWPDIKGKLRTAASERWSKKSTLQSELSRITKISVIAQDLLARGRNMADGEDPDFLRALSAIRERMEALNIKSLKELEVAAHGRRLNYIYHLFTKKRKYRPNRSKSALARLEVLCEFLDLKWEKMHADLFDKIVKRPTTSKLSPSAFEYTIKIDELPQSLQDDIVDIFRFHRGAFPGRRPDGTTKRRTKKAQWKVRSTDGKCNSEENLKSLLGSLFGYCLLPKDKSTALARVQKRLERTDVSWREGDLDMYAEWVTGLGMKAKDLSIGLLFDHVLVEQWLTWTASRNGGVTRTQVTYCILLYGLLDGRTGPISQSYEIARKLQNYPSVPDGLRGEEEKAQFASRMAEWVGKCAEASEIYKDFKEYFSSPKLKRKRKAISRHDSILSLEDPLEPVQKMLQRMHDAEPRHLGRESLSWKLWVRNVTLIELLVSNPLRADNICYLRYSPDDTGTLRISDKHCEILIEKHEVKNPHHEEEFGYRGEVGESASAWLKFYIESVRPFWETDVPVEKCLFLTRTGKAVNVIELRSITIGLSEQFLPEFSALNPHAFRHIVATSWLKRHPDDFVTVSLILGDRLGTVMSNYAHLASRDGLIRYHRHLAQWPRNFPISTGGR